MISPAAADDNCVVSTWAVGQRISWIISPSVDELTMPRYQLIQLLFAASFLLCTRAVPPNPMHMGERDDSLVSTILGTEVSAGVCYFFLKQVILRTPFQ